jgi:hypothetical protein
MLSSADVKARKNCRKYVQAERLTMAVPTGKSVPVASIDVAGDDG